MKRIEGGFSEGIVKSLQWKNYVGNKAVFGYIGESHRTKERDTILEQALRDTGLEDEGIACWLTSTTGRHLMDGVGRRTTKEEFIQLVKACVENAFEDVTIWSHPDHEGTLRSTYILREKIFGK